MSGQCAGIRIRRSWSTGCPALAPESGVVLPVREKVVRDLCSLAAVAAVASALDCPLSGRTYCELLGIVRVLCAVAGRCCCCHRCCQLSSGCPAASRPARCRGWPAAGPGRLLPGPWFLAGVPVERLMTSPTRLLREAHAAAATDGSQPGASDGGGICQASNPVGDLPSTPGGPRPVSIYRLSFRLIHPRSPTCAMGRRICLSLAVYGRELGRTRSNRLGKSVGGNRREIA